MCVLLLICLYSLHSLHSINCGLIVLHTFSSLSPSFSLQSSVRFDSVFPVQSSYDTNLSACACANVCVLGEGKKTGEGEAVFLFLFLFFFVGLESVCPSLINTLPLCTLLSFSHCNGARIAKSEASFVCSLFL